MVKGMSINIPMDDEVKEILSRATVGEGPAREGPAREGPARVILPPEKLERKLYERVNKTLVAMGGRWDRRAQAHVFDQEPRVKDLRGALQTLGKGLDIVDRKKTLQAFYTPRPLAERMWALADVPEDGRVLEPSAGTGAIVATCPDPSVFITCVEVDENSCVSLRTSRARLIVRCYDFLTTIPKGGPGSLYTPFDAVIMNPPFNKGQDVKHLLHAWEFVRPGGTLVAILSPGYTFRKGYYQAKARHLIEQWEFHQEELPPDTFKESGTSVRTMLVALRKP